jgi:hypothetical protein
MATDKTQRGDQSRGRCPARVPTGADNPIVLWDGPDRVRCVISHYDEARYQLRLLRGDGTIKSDLFSDHSRALAASREWQQDSQRPFRR